MAGKKLMISDDVHAAPLKACLTLALALSVSMGTARCQSATSSSTSMTAWHVASFRYYASIRRLSGHSGRCKRPSSIDYGLVFRRRYRAGAARNQAVMLDAAVFRKIEDRILAEGGDVEVASVNQQ